MSSSESLSTRCAAMASALGFACVVALAFAVPLAFVPTGWWPWFRPHTSEVVVFKGIVLRCLCAGVLVAASAVFALRGARDYRGAARLPALLLLAFIGWALLAVLFSAAPRTSFQAWMNQFFLMLAALASPMLLNAGEGVTTRIKWLVGAALLSGVVVAFIAAVGGLGFRGFNTMIYGMDPRDAASDPVMRQRLQGTLQGGMSRAASMGTLANPEYLGSLMAPLAAMLAVLLLDGAGRRGGGHLMRAVVAGALAVTLLAMALSGARQPWAALAMAAMLRLMLALGAPLRRVAAMACVMTLAALFLGIAAGLGVFLAGILFELAMAWRHGTLGALWGRASRFQRLATAGLPAAMLLLLLVFSVPGPWNPFGLGLVQRFASLATREDQSLHERVMMYMIAGEVARDNPVFGAGPGFFANRFTLELAELANNDESGVMLTQRLKAGNVVGRHAHNDYLQLAAETGVVGMALFLGMLLALLRALVQVQRDREEGARPLAALVLLAGLMAFAAVMFSSFPLQTPARATVFWVLVAAALALVSREGRAIVASGNKAAAP